MEANSATFPSSKAFDTDGDSVTLDMQCEGDNRKILSSSHCGMETKNEQFISDADMNTEIRTGCTVPSTNNFTESQVDLSASAMKAQTEVTSSFGDTIATVTNNDCCLVHEEACVPAVDPITIHDGQSCVRTPAAAAAGSGCSTGSLAQSCSDVPQVEITVGKGKTDNVEMKYRGGVVEVGDSAESSSSSSESEDELSDGEKNVPPRARFVKPSQGNEASDDDDKKGETMLTKGELTPRDLPPLTKLQITVRDDVVMAEVGFVSGIVDVLVVVQAKKDSKALNMDTLLFLDDRKVMGEVFETFGPVTAPYYSVRFNTAQAIVDFGVKIGDKVYYAPDESQYTHYIFMEQIRSHKGSDASWDNNNEPPAKFLDYSDDEQERNAKKKNKKKCVENGSDSDGSQDRQQKGKKRIRNRNGRFDSFAHHPGGHYSDVNPFKHMGRGPRHAPPPQQWPPTRDQCTSFHAPTPPPQMFVDIPRSTAGWNHPPMSPWGGGEPSRAQQCLPIRHNAPMAQCWNSPNSASQAARGSNFGSRPPGFGVRFLNHSQQLSNGQNQPINGPSQQLNGPNQPPNGPNAPMSGPNQPMNGLVQPMNGPNQPLNGPNSLMNGPNQQLNGPNHRLNVPNQPMNGSNQLMSGPSQQLNGFNQQMSGPNSLMNGPNQHLNGPNQLMNTPSQLMNVPNQQMNGANQLMSGLIQQMNGPNQLMSGPNPLINGFNPLMNGQNQFTNGPYQQQQGSNNMAGGHSRPHHMINGPVISPGQSFSGLRQPFNGPPPAPMNQPQRWTFGSTQQNNWN